MTKQLRNPFKQTKLKAIFFFLLLATVFWILTKYSRQYTATVRASINYVNLPKNTLITDENLKSVSFNLTTSGFEFLFYKLKMPSIEIDVNSYYLPSQKKAVVPNNELVKLISAYLNVNTEIKNMEINELIIELDDLVTRKVPVFVNANFTYKVGFIPVDSILVVPDSIVVSGPAEILKDINLVETKEVLGKDLDRNVSLPAVLINKYANKVLFTPNEVNVSVPISEFLQKEMVLAIELINVPLGITIKLIPNSVSVKFNVSIDDFKKIKETNFKLICDYSDRNIQENFMIPKLELVPKGIIDIEFSTKRIDYLIFK